MKIVEPSATFEYPVDGLELLRRIEKAGRTCYKSEDKATEDSCKKFVAMIIKRGHTSVLEHASISVRVVCDRGVSHEWVRHRIASYSQESTRYCNYGKSGEITFIRPCFFEEGSDSYWRWYNACDCAARTYLQLLDRGATPQEARSVLPNSLKTEFVTTKNLRSWRNFFSLRADKAAHPQMRQLAVPLLSLFKQTIPVVFDDIFPEENG